MEVQVVLIVLILSTLCWARYDYRYNPTLKRYTEPPIRIKQGQLQGIVVEQSGIRGCEKYLGIPYAAPPVGELRFMPPGSAPPWPKVLFADSPGPVCPQKIPDLKGMSSERKEKFRKLAEHLANESEDCLFLNIYTPIQDGHRDQKKYPVIVYIHGESYEWNSGNPYDGCVLASYGNVVFVTINFRLGILGFLKTGVSDQTHSNFGLVDQVAALLWVQENIAAFGGNPRSVTLMGHGTGAACVNFLMVSPMVARDAEHELFHRAILMSGSALADWALATNSIQLTMQVAQELNCPLTDDGLAACLRRKRLMEIMSVPVMAPPYVTKFGPIVDGLVVPNIPRHLMSTYNDLFSRYEMMFGVTEIESDHLLGNVALIHGLLERERNEILRQYLQARFEYQPGPALASTLSEYTDPSETSSLNCRNTVLEVLSDARVAAPVVQTGNYHSAVNPKSYFYVFGHSTISKDFLGVYYEKRHVSMDQTWTQFLREKSLHGEELQYVLGAPLGGARELFNAYYTDEEKLFSEIIMTLWTNFAHTGNPIAPHRNSFLNMKPTDWERNWPRDWPEYDAKKQPYMLLAIPPSVQTKYRQQLMQYWNEILPQVLKNQTAGVPVRSKYKVTPAPRPARPFPPILQPNQFGRGIPQFIPRATSTEHLPYDPGRSSGWSFGSGVRTTLPPVFGSIKTQVDIDDRKPEDMLGTRNAEHGKDITPTPETETTNTTMNILIVVGSLFLLVNALTFAGLYYKRKRLRTQERILKRQYEETNLLPVSESSPEKKAKLDETVDPEAPQRGCNVMKMIRQSTTKSEDTYEAVIKQSEDESSNPRFKLTSQISTSTIDPHTKVRDWIAHEIVQRCSPRFLRRTRQQFALEHKLNQQREQEKKKGQKTPETKTLVSNTTTGKSSTRPTSPTGKNSNVSMQKTHSKQPSNQHSKGTTSCIPKKPKKVSVAIDATPGARGSSVLKQQPIELSKSMDLLKKEPENKPLRRSVTMDDFLIAGPQENEPSVRRSITSINLTIQSPSKKGSNNMNIQPRSDVIKIHHQHSRSDPVPMTSGSFDETVRMKTFDVGGDINVTSRDESSIQDPPLSPEEALETIKKRNFPKVLPDFPDQQAHSNAFKRRSLPPQSFLFFSPISEQRKTPPNPSNSLKNYSRIPPAPPPRTSSTLGRKPSKPSLPSHPIPVQLVEEAVSPQEPKMTSNTLHVGPLIPCRQPRKMTDADGSRSYRLNTQPIYDNLRTPEEKVPEVKKQVPKTIITTDPDQPVKKVEQPKVIIKPTITKKVNDPSKVNKVVPRVVARDISSEGEEGKEIIEDRKKKEEIQKSKLIKLSQIPTFCKSGKNQSSSESSSSTLDGSDTGTVVKRE